MENFLNDKLTDYFCLYCGEHSILLIHLVFYCLSRVIKYYLPESSEETTYEYAYSIENDVDTTGYVKPSHLNTAQCQFATNRDTIMPTGSHNGVYSVVM